MNDVIFREYDIRGIVDKDFYINEVYDFTRALAFYFRQKNPSLDTIAIGIDGRIHSLSIKSEISRALNDCGINVLFVGLCPTPALYFTLFTEPVDGGLMITASHNSKEYNGIKVCLGKTSIWGAELQEIKNLYKQKKFLPYAPTKGSETFCYIVDRYTAWLATHFQHLYGNSFSITIDCGNGTAGTVLPQIISRLALSNVTLLYPEVDGTYPNHEADPTVAKNMEDLKHKLSTTPALFGIGLDGDCDRMVPMTKEGTLVPGDQLLALFAQPVLQQNGAQPIVFDIKSSAGLIDLLEQWHGKPIMSPSGHSIIKNTMHIHNALLGGELSGHFFFKDRYFGYDDGIYALLRLIEIMQITKQSLNQLLAQFPIKYSSPELRIPCPEENKHQIIADLKSLLSSLPNISLVTIDGIRAILPYGWGIIRPSNTQAVLSMRFESDSQTGLKDIIRFFYTILQQYQALPTLELLRHQLEIL